MTSTKELLKRITEVTDLAVSLHSRIVSLERSAKETEQTIAKLHERLNAQNSIARKKEPTIPLVSYCFAPILRIRTSLRKLCILYCNYILYIIYMYIQYLLTYKFDKWHLL